MDISEFMGSNVTLDLIRNSPTKKAVIINPGETKVFPDGKTKPCILVDMDQKQVTWIPNKTSMRFVSAIYGTDTIKWVGKQLIFSVGVVNGKEAVISKPIETVVGAIN